MKPPAPASSEIDIPGTGGDEQDADVLKITCPPGRGSGSGEMLSFELLSQDLLYAYESATNQLVFAEGDESAPVNLKNGIFQSTSTFCIRLDPARKKKDVEEKFTLQQLRAIVETLFEFGDRFRTRNMEFSYKLQREQRHLIGFLQSDPIRSCAITPTSSSDETSTPSNSTTHNTNIVIVGGRDIAASHTARAWDPHRRPPPARITFSQ